MYVVLKDSATIGDELSSQIYRVDADGEIQPVYYKAQNILVKNNTVAYNLVIEDPYTMFGMSHLPVDSTGGYSIARPSEPTSSKLGTFSLKDGVLFKDFTIFGGLKHKDHMDIEFDYETGTIVRMFELELPFEEVSEAEALSSRKSAWAFNTGLGEDVELPDIDVPDVDAPVDNTPPVEDKPVENEPVDDLPVEDDLKEDTHPVIEVPKEDVPVLEQPVEDTPVNNDEEVRDVPVVTPSDSEQENIVEVNRNLSGLEEELSPIAAVEEDDSKSTASASGESATADESGVQEEDASDEAIVASESEEELPQTGSSLAAVTTAIGSTFVALGAGLIKKKRN